MGRFKASDDMGIDDTHGSSIALSRWESEVYFGQVRSRDEFDEEVYPVVIRLVKQPVHN